MAAAQVAMAIAEKEWGSCILSTRLGLSQPRAGGSGKGSFWVTRTLVHGLWGRWARGCKPLVYTAVGEQEQNTCACRLMTNEQM